MKIVVSGVASRGFPAPIVAEFPLGFLGEYVILHVLGLMPDSQSLIRTGKHSFDKLEAHDPKTGGKVTLYFNIDKPMGYLHKILSK
jgi:hypothetical protein